MEGASLKNCQCMAHIFKILHSHSVRCVFNLCCNCKNKFKKIDSFINKGENKSHFLLQSSLFIQYNQQPFSVCVYLYFTGVYSEKTRFVVVVNLISFSICVLYVILNGATSLFWQINNWGYQTTMFNKLSYMCL